VKDGPHVAWADHFGTRCEVPDFAGAARRRHSERVAAFRHAARKALPYAAGAGMALLAFAAYAWRRRRARNA
jgi:MYXO-CTERM domain-containing protein